MCGIVGFLGPQSADQSIWLQILQTMTRELSHRGPDAEGFFQTSDGVLGLGHRRLSIIDLSAAGAQPMSTRDGQFVLCYNGEIYNFSELRDILSASGVQFIGSSDTEVLLQAIAHWGLEATLPRLNGMFALALWDARERKLWLARDRFGEKPLYYAWHAGYLLFASELKAMRRHPAFRREIDRGALSLYTRYNYIPSPHCIYRDAWKLPAGHYLCLTPGLEPAPPKPYWRLPDMVAGRKLIGSAADAPALLQMLEAQLKRAVKLRMVADVPLGAFLSGGVDSTLVVALMQAQSAKPIKTFTIGFWETAYNEAEDAGRVARHLGTEHHEFYVSNRECLDVISRLPQLYDEPFADSSQIPTTLVSQFTRRHVTVALSGDGGDEFWGGYNRYFWSKRIWPRLQRLPRHARLNLSALIQRGSPSDWDRLAEATNHLLPLNLRVRNAGDKLHKLAQAMLAETPDDLYRSLVSHGTHSSETLIEDSETDFLMSHIEAIPRGLDYVERMMFLDTMTYLTDDILCKVDRASMSCGLEARVPYLDNDLVSLAWSIPIDVRIHKGIGKWPLRQVLSNYVPSKLVERPKAGFGIPIGEWMRGPLREWVEEMLSESRLRTDGFFQPEVVRKYWADHLSGRYNHQDVLWGVLMFQSWYDQEPQ